MPSKRTLIVVAVGVGLMAAASATRSQEAESDDGLTVLLKEREKTLKALVEVTEERYRLGSTRNNPNDVILASNLLLEAQLDLANTDEKRIKLHEQLVTNFLKLEAISEARLRAGTSTVEDALKAKAARLKAEIELERLKHS